jgi:NAD(P)-dependent dehydrogenase (short-subunit alcohol dehydrogenase family)
MRLQGKIALITEAGTGIGRATAELFAREGAFVEIAEVDDTTAQETAQAIHQAGGEAVSTQVDVSDQASVESWCAQVLGRHDRVDVLFNNAGISAVGALHDVSEELWEKVLAVNLTGVYRVCKAFVPTMMARRGGSIINMSSAIVHTGLLRRAAYSATKGAILAMTKSMQVDYAPYNIRVNALLPGTILTPFVERYLGESYDDPEDPKQTLRQRQLAPELGTPEDVNFADLYLASDEARYVWGSGLIVEGGTTAGKPY